MKISRYVRVFRYDDWESILYNTIDHSIITIPTEYVIDGEMNSKLDSESVAALDEMGYLSTKDDKILAEIENYFVNKDKLFVSLELNLSCNLRCSYCYQSESESEKKRLISDSDLDSLADYFEKVYEKEKFNHLFLKILGGEPTLAWEKFSYIFKKTKEFCHRKNVRYHVLIDTNGTNIDNILELNDYESLLLNVPLTYKDCHDSVRFDEFGNGTYAKIINNLNKLNLKKPNTKIVLRYNVDEKNILHFEDYLMDLKLKLQFNPLISINYTAELNGNNEFRNKLTYERFIQWSSTDAIDMLVKENLPVTISPIISIEECQYRSKYSLKLFSDGTVGSCAMSYFDLKREKISDITNNFDDQTLFNIDKANQSLRVDEECKACSSLFMCGGTNKLPCLKVIDSNMCKNKKFGILLQEFLLRYVKYKNEQKGNLFLVFENGESYR